ncbi:MAG: hypothetical protein QM501_04920, partial [Gimesia sp.]
SFRQRPTSLHVDEFLVGTLYIDGLLVIMTFKVGQMDAIRKDACRFVGWADFADCGDCVLLNHRKWFECIGFCVAEVLLARLYCQFMSRCIICKLIGSAISSESLIPKLKYWT